MWAHEQRLMAQVRYQMQHQPVQENWPMQDRPAPVRRMVRSVGVAVGSLLIAVGQRLQPDERVTVLQQ